MKRKSLALLIFVLFFSLAPGVTDVAHLDEEQAIAFFAAYTPTAGNCGKPTFSWADGACTSNAQKLWATRRWKLTRATGIPIAGWGGARACDLDVTIGGTGAGDGTVVGFLRAGGGDEDGFRAIGTAGFTTVFSNPIIEAGDLMQVEHNNPDPLDQYCLNGSGCSCESTVGYFVVLWGVPY